MLGGRNTTASSKLTVWKYIIEYIANTVDFKEKLIQSKAAVEKAMKNVFFKQLADCISKS